MNRILLSFLILTLSLPLWAANQPVGAPPSFATLQGKAVFMKVKEALHEITYDMAQQKAFAKTRMTFEIFEEGFPVFDLIPEPSSAQLNGKSLVSTTLAKPADLSTTYRMLSQSLKPGVHELVLKNPITKGMVFHNGNVWSAQWMSDLSDRRYMEQFLPTNLEFDQYPKTYQIKFIGAKAEQVIFTNGALKKLSSSEFEILFPDYFTASSIFFHTLPKGIPFPPKDPAQTAVGWKSVEFKIPSLRGNPIPTVIYGKDTVNLVPFVEMTKKVIAELEKDYGPWAHPTLVINASTGGGGMEYCGATRSSLWALGHELTHSYFARGVMPVNGNAGWIDEAVASWRDRGYLTKDLPPTTDGKMGGHSPYQRYTDSQAYRKGSHFLGNIDFLFGKAGGLKAHLRTLFQRKSLKPISTPEFQEFLEKASGVNLQKGFDTYVYGKIKLPPPPPKGGPKVPPPPPKFPGVPMMEMETGENPYHPKLTKEELREMLGG